MSTALLLAGSKVEETQLLLLTLEAEAGASLSALALEKAEK